MGLEVFLEAEAYFVKLTEAHDVFQVIRWHAIRRFAINDALVNYLECGFVQLTWSKRKAAVTQVASALTPCRRQHGV